MCLSHVYHMTLQKERLSQLRKERELEEFENENKVREGGDREGGKRKEGKVGNDPSSLYL